MLHEAYAETMAGLPLPVLFLIFALTLPFALVLGYYVGKWLRMGKQY